MKADSIEEIVGLGRKVEACYFCKTEFGSNIMIEVLDFSLFRDMTKMKEDHGELMIIGEYHRKELHKKLDAFIDTGKRNES